MACPGLVSPATNRPPGSWWKKFIPSSTQPGARDLGELHLQLDLLVPDDLDEVGDLLGVELRDLGGPLGDAHVTDLAGQDHQIARRRDVIFWSGKSSASWVLRRSRLRVTCSARTSGSSRLFQSVRSVVPTPREVSRSCTGVMTFRSATRGSATETRPIGSVSTRRRFWPVSSARFLTAPTSRSMRIAGTAAQPRIIRGESATRAHRQPGQRRCEKDGARLH